jgi:hypothetical protein
VSQDKVPVTILRGALLLIFLTPRFIGQVFPLQYGAHVLNLC